MPLARARVEAAVVKFLRFRATGRLAAPANSWADSPAKRGRGTPAAQHAARAWGVNTAVPVNTRSVPELLIVVLGRLKPMERQKAAVGLFA